MAAANRRDNAHLLARAAVTELGRDLIVPVPVLAEADYFLRTRVGADAARDLWQSVVDGEHLLASVSRALLEEALEFELRFAALDLGLVDCVIMALAQREDLPILTFDFGHFRATYPASGYWQLIVDEGRFREEIEG